MQDPIKKQRRSDQNLDAEKKPKAGEKPVKPKGKELVKAPETNEPETKEPETKVPKTPKVLKVPRKSRKSHKKKGTASDAPPSSIGMTQVAFAALLAIEAENPEMTRKQIFENALNLLAGHIAYLPPIQLARLNNNTLITLAAVAAEREKSCKKILRDIYLSQLDEEEKTKHSAELGKEIQSLKDARLIMLRKAGIPISHDLTTNVGLVIAELKLSKEVAVKEKKPKYYQNAFDDAILILTAYQPIAPMDAAKTAGKPPQDQEAESES